MAEDEEYELTPHKELEELKREVERLKKNPLGKSASAKDLMTSVQELNANICRLIDIFETAFKDMKEGHAEPEDNSGDMKKVLDTLIEQNKNIAEGILSVADMLQEKNKPAQPVPSGPPGLGPGTPDFGGPLGSPEQNMGAPPGLGGPPGMPPPGAAPPGGPPRPGGMPDPLARQGGLPPLPPLSAPEEKPKKKGFFHK